MILGTADDPGGNTLIVHGNGKAIRNRTSTAVSALGNSFQIDGTLLTSGFDIEDIVKEMSDRSD